MPHTDWTLFLGRFHPLLVHLPIGFLTILAAVELVARVGRFRQVAEARGVILAAAAAAAVLSVVAGLMLSSGGGYDQHLLFWHKWTGITLAGFVWLTAIAHHRHRRRAYGGLLVATLALLVPASHFGGSMTHGADYLTAYAPSWIRSLAGTPTRRPTTAVAVVADPAQAHLYADLVRPVFAQDCVSCHGPDRSSGRLQLDAIESIRRGGQSGPAITAGHVDTSLVLARLSLPTTDAKHMPPADQPQPTADQVAVISWWVASGAGDPPIAAVQASPDQSELVARLLHVPTQPRSTDQPRPWAEVAPIAADLSATLRATIAPTALDQPWLTCSARTNPTFGDRELLALSPLARNVTSLDLAGTAVTDGGLNAVGAMVNLRQLHLERTRITDKGLSALLPLRKLEYLNLYGTGVTDASLATLRPLPSLSKLYVWQTKVTPAAATAFADAVIDPAKVRDWQQQITDLQARITQQHRAVVGAATTQPRPK